MAKAKPPALSPTRAWQALVPELPPFITADSDERSARRGAAADTAERLLLLLHYSIDWKHGWVADRWKTYWDNEFPAHVWGAATRSDTLDGWWSDVSRRLDVLAPRQADRRLELATLLREPADPVITALRDDLPALVLRVRIITDAVSATRREPSR